MYMLNCTSIEQLFNTGNRPDNESKSKNFGNNFIFPKILASLDLKKNGGNTIISYIVYKTILVKHLYIQKMVKVNIKLNHLI